MIKNVFLLIQIFLLISLFSCENFNIDQNIESSKILYNFNQENIYKPFFENSFYEKIKIYNTSKKMIEINLHYRIWKNFDNFQVFKKGKIKKLFLIHGFAGSTYSWENFSNSLIEYFNNIEENIFIVAVDIPNFGFSQRIREKLTDEDFSILFFKLLLLLDQEFKIDNFEWITFGHSMGGRIVFIFNTIYYIFNKNKFENEKTFDKLKDLLTKNDLLDYLRNKKIFLSNKIFLVAPALFSNNSLNLFIHNYTLNKILINLVKANINFNNIKRILKEVYKKEPSLKDIYGYLNPLLINDTVENVIFMLERKNLIDIEYFLNKIDLELIFIWGEKDSLVPLNQYNNDLINKIKNKKLYIIKDSGHCPMETDINDFLKIIINELIFSTSNN